MKGLSPEQRQQDLAGQIEKLLAQLNSAQHLTETPTIVYGTHNPLEVDLALCDTCSGEGVLAKSNANKAKQRWQVRCRCCSKVSGQPTRNPWTAALMWNGVNLQSMKYSELPLFGLSGLSPRDAHERVKGIRANLVLRISLCSAEHQLFNAGGSNRKPGASYTAKLEAYLLWAMLAHRLIKLARARPRMQR